jgi:hypothetical protein
VGSVPKQFYRYPVSNASFGQLDLDSERPFLDCYDSRRSLPKRGFTREDAIFLPQFFPERKGGNENSFRWIASISSLLDLRASFHDCTSLCLSTDNKIYSGHGFGKHSRRLWVDGRHWRELFDFPADLSEAIIRKITVGQGKSGFLEIHRSNGNTFGISAELQ